MARVGKDVERIKKPMSVKLPAKPVEQPVKAPAKREPVKV